MSAARATLALEAVVRWREARRVLLVPGATDNELHAAATDWREAEHRLAAIADAEIADQAAAAARAQSRTAPTAEDGA